MDPTDQDYENLLASLNAEIRYYHRTMIQVLFDKINIAKWELGLVVTDRPMLDDLNTIIEEYANFYTDAPTGKEEYDMFKDGMSKNSFPYVTLLTTS
jgi:trans-aconitate methyltransferase